MAEVRYGAEVREREQVIFANFAEAAAGIFRSIVMAGGGVVERVVECEEVGA